MSKIIAVANQKGGVGKTFLVFHLAHFLWEKKASVLAIDLDPQGNLTLCFSLGYKIILENCPAAQIFEKEKLVYFPLEKNFWLCGSDIQLARCEAQFSGVGAYFKLKKVLSKLEKQPDYILIDCPPSLGLFSISAFVAANKLLIPLRAEVFSISGLADLLNVVEEIRENINPELENAGLVLNAVNPRTRVARDTIEALKTEQNLNVLATISASIKVEEALRTGRPLWQLSPGHKMTTSLKEALHSIVSSL